MRRIQAWVVVLSAAGLAGCGGGSTTQPSKQANPVIIEAQTHFTYKGKPIPPFFLADFCGGPDAGDFWTQGMGERICAVDVAGFFYDNSDGSYSDRTVEHGEFVRFDLPSTGDEGSRGAGWLSYKFLGTTPSGVTVLEYVGNTGGSGTIPGVVFIRFELETLGYTKAGKKDRLIMRFLGEESWGDRVYRDVTLVGNELRLGPERSHMPGATDSLEPARTILLE